jgi:uncharacterized linocin/CFP29 family protein
MNVVPIRLHKADQDAHVRARRENEVAELFQDAMRAIGELEKLTHDRDYRLIMGKDFYGSCAIVALTGTIIYDRVERTVLLGE